MCTKSGVQRGRAIRRTTSPWRGELVLAIDVQPYGKQKQKEVKQLQSSLVLPSIVEEIADNKEEDSVTPTSKGGSDGQLLPDDATLSDLLGGNSQAGGASGSAPSGVQRQPWRNG